MIETTNDRNVTLSIKMKKDWVSLEVTAMGWDSEGFYIGEDFYALDEFDYSQEEECFYSKDGRLRIQI